MSWWIYLEDADGNKAEVENHREGGTYAIGGTTEAELNVTYNYSAVTSLIDFNFRTSLDGKTVDDTIPVLERVVKKLGTRQNNDYWAATPGNAGYAASILLGWAKQYAGQPYRWRVS